MSYTEASKHPLVGKAFIDFTGDRELVGKIEHVFSSGSTSVGDLMMFTAFDIGQAASKEKQATLTARTGEILMQLAVIVGGNFLIFHDARAIEAWLNTPSGQARWSTT